MVSALAKNGAAKLVKQAAQNKAVKMAIDELRDAVVKALATSVTTSGTATLMRLFASRKNRGLAVELARQIGGTYEQGHHRS